MTEQTKNPELLENEDKLNPHKIHYEIARLLMYQGVDEFKVEGSDARYFFYGSDPKVCKVDYKINRSGPTQYFDYSKIARKGKENEPDIVLLIKKCVD